MSSHAVPLAHSITASPFCLNANFHELISVGSSIFSEATTWIVHPITESLGYVVHTTHAAQTEAAYRLSVHQNLTTSSVRRSQTELLAWKA